MLIRKVLFLIIGLGLCVFAFSQTPEDALKNAWFIPNGTARSISIGGAMGSLGGDISAVYNNPAGLGMYKTSEFVVTPSMLINNNKADFRGTNTSNINKSGFQLGTMGVVIGGRMNRAYNSSAFAISLNQLGSYNNRIHYSGLNDASSYSEQYLEELTNNNANVNSALNDYPFTSSLAFITYLIDSVADRNGNLLGYRSLVPVGNGNSIHQEYDEVTKGGLYELSFGFASNQRDKLYLGASINIPLSFYTQDIDYVESDISGNENNDFGFSQLTQHHTLSGAGLNARLGIIYDVQNSLRLGLTIHTPSIITFTDNLDVSMTTNTEDYAGTQSIKSSDFSNAASETKYNEITPYKIVASASYILSEVENVKMQKGFIAADIEYVNYRGSRFSQEGDDNDESLADYYDALNDVIKSYYKGAVNFRLGGELKFSPFAVRLGGAYYGSPYKDKNLKANRILAAGGIGYRNKGFFVDLTFAETFNKDVNFPYRLQDKANTFAQLKNKRTNVLLTFGVKF
jgi:hypothetical protein